MGICGSHAKNNNKENNQASQTIMIQTQPVPGAPDQSKKNPEAFMTKWVETYGGPGAAEKLFGAESLAQKETPSIKQARLEAIEKEILAAEQDIAQKAAIKSKSKFATGTSKTFTFNENPQKENKSTELAAQNVGIGVDPDFMKQLDDLHQVPLKEIEQSKPNTAAVRTTKEETGLLMLG